MRDRQVAEHFEHAIASFPIAATESADALSDDLRDRVRVAGRLMALDFGDESRVRDSLRRGLAQAWEARRRHSGEVAQRKLWVLRRPLPALGLGGALMVALVVPASRAVIARPFLQLIEAVGIGGHSQVVRTEPPTQEEVARNIEHLGTAVAKGQQWFVHTPYGGFAGGVPPGQSAVIRRVDSLQNLQALTTLKLQMPTSSHRGQTVQFSHADVAPDGVVLMYFGSGPNELLLIEAPVGEGRSAVYSRTVGGTTPDGRMVFESPKLMTEELTLNSRAVVWDPDNTGLNRNSSALRWEADDIAYSLTGRSLTREEAVELFLSLRPLDR